MARRKRRLVIPRREPFIDPLGQEWADVKAAMAGYEAQEYACQKMAEFTPLAMLGSPVDWWHVVSARRTKPSKSCAGCLKR
jgi:hypothetical protein